MSQPRKAKKKKKILSAAEKAIARIKRDHTRYARSLFYNIGFSRINSASDKEFCFDGITSDFDDVFVYENVIVIAEYTASSESNVSAHLKNKAYIYNLANKDTVKFIEFLKTKFPLFSEALPKIYSTHHFQLRFVYASRYSIKEEAKAVVDGVSYLDYSILRYFENVSGTIKSSGRYEFLNFINVDANKFSKSILSTTSGSGDYYSGSILPEAHSHFPAGFKVVSFYVDAAALLKRSYVLRRDSWREGGDIYQRMIIRSKVEKIRKHLLDGANVFVNNIIATLPANSKIIDEKDNSIDVSKIMDTTPGKVSLPVRYNSIGLIDGQHRVYSYHEGGTRETEMEVLRSQQNLLVTGIMFPETMTEAERMRFEAKLFIEINSNQTSAKSDLIQEIGLILKPYSPDSISKRVVNHLNSGHGPLSDIFQVHFYDKTKLKTTTVVSYGLRPLMKLQGEDSLILAWNDAEKDKLVKEQSDTALTKYIDFSVKEINLFFSAVKANLPSGVWHSDRKNGGILNITFINGVISLLRRVVKSNKMGDFDSYKKALQGLDTFSFSTYKSSQYNKLGQAIYEKHFL